MLMILFILSFYLSSLKVSPLLNASHIQADSIAAAQKHSLIFACLVVKNMFPINHAVHA